MDPTCSIIELGQLLITLQHLFNVRFHNVDDLVHLRLRRLQPFLRGDLLRRSRTSDDPVGTCACTRSSIRCQTAFGGPVNPLLISHSNCPNKFPSIQQI